MIKEKTKKTKTQINREEKLLFNEAFKTFSRYYSFAFNNDKNKCVNWYSWGTVINKKTNKVRIFAATGTKGVFLSGRIVDDENLESNIKKFERIKNKTGYFVVVFEATQSIKNKLELSINIQKVFRKARRRSAINLAHKFWYKKKYPDREYFPYYHEEKRHVSEENIEKMKERGKHLFEILSSKHKITCPRCDFVFVNFSKNISIQCPTCGSKFLVEQKKS